LKNKLIRIAKIISHSGLCSRREAESLIKNGAVKINNKVVTEFSVNFEDIEKISVNKKKLTRQPTRIWLFYKPKNYVCSNKEQKNQKSIFRLIPKKFPRVISVGRLDINSEGLLLLTNNPDLSSFLENPQNKIERIYNVKVSGKIPDNLEKQTTNGIVVDGFVYKKVIIKVLTKKKNNNWIEMTLTEGKNREIRKILNFFDLKVKILKRISFGPFEIEDLKPTEMKEIDKNLNQIYKSLNFNHENYFW